MLEKCCYRAKLAKIHVFLLVEPDLVRLLTIALYHNEYREQFMLFVLILSQEVYELRSLQIVYAIFYFFVSILAFSANIRK